MDRTRVGCLHYITPLTNLPSILRHGLLCHERAKQLPHDSVASPVIQDRRTGKIVPGGLKLHQYVNLYFDARNSMMYVLVSNNCPPLAVLKIHPGVLDLPGVVVSDGNAAADTTRFYEPSEGVAALDDDLVFARSWNHPDYWEKQERKRIRSAEVLVPERLGTEYVVGVLVRNAEDRDYITSHNLSVEVKPDVFFR